MWHLGLDTVGGHSNRHGCSIWEDFNGAKGWCLVNADDDTNDTNNLGSNDLKPVLGVSSHVGNGCASYNSNGGFDCRLCCRFELQFHSLLGWYYAFWKGRGLDLEVL
jgi:hypothetical protein